ncbi:MAG: alpha/beta hydrolase, partial [Candidatus Hodarchaeota archaeon]
MTPKSIYRSSEGKNVLLDIYDKQLSNLNRKYEDIYVQTRYGKTHIINIGRKNSIPLICLHGGNSNIPDMLISNLPMLENFNIYSIDIIGHP